MSMSLISSVRSIPDLACGGWNKLCDDGQLDEAFDAIDLLVQRGAPVPILMVWRLAKECIAKKHADLGSRLHALAVRNGHESNTALGNQFLRMYVSQGNLEEASKVFNKLPAPDVFGWASIISAHCEQGQAAQAIQLYMQMRRTNVKANNYVYVAVLKACTNAVDVASGQLVHADVMDDGLESNRFVGNTLVNMYCKLGKLDEAQKVFERLPVRNVVTWTALIAGYAQHGLCQHALTLFHRMQEQDVAPNNLTYLAALRACASIRAVQEGRRIHSQVLADGLGTDVFVGSALMSMYAECGNLEGACEVFESMQSKNVVTWTTIISCHTQYGFGWEAIELYRRMLLDGVVADIVTLGCVLTACGSIGALQMGRQVHGDIARRGLDLNVVVCSTLINMYIDCASLAEARMVFDKLSTSNIVPWTAMISGYTRHGYGQEALELYWKMEQAGLRPDNVAFVSILQACGSIGAVQEGKRIHTQLIRLGLEGDLCIGSSLIHMYSKCGGLVEAKRVFDKVPTRSVVTWTAMIDCYGQHNKGQVAVQCFEDMLEEGVEPDATTFICLLNACSHIGLVSEGQQYLKAMKKTHGIVPSIEHYNCLVDLLSRSGRLDEAEALLSTMPFESDWVGWMTLLSACETYRNVELGRRCFDRLAQLDPSHAAGYVLMANIYADAGRMEDANGIEHMRKSAGVQKKPAKALIEVNGKVHEFIVGEQGYFRRDCGDLNAKAVDLEQRDLILGKLRSLSVRMKNEGHVPCTYLVRKPISDREKEDALCGHAEKLAVAFGLLSTPDGTPLLVVKSLRMCKDCHNGTKIVSKIEGRDIIVRDAHRVHHFSAGSCSCGDRP